MWPSIYQARCHTAWEIGMGRQDVICVLDFLQLDKNKHLMIQGTVDLRSKVLNVMAVQVRETCLVVTDFKNLRLKNRDGKRIGEESQEIVWLSTTLFQGGAF